MKTRVCLGKGYSCTLRVNNHVEYTCTLTLTTQSKVLTMREFIENIHGKVENFGINRHLFYSFPTMFSIPVFLGVIKRQEPFVENEHITYKITL